MIKRILIAVLCAGTVFGQASDTAGPLRVTIQGPQEVVQTGVPLPVQVTLANSSAAAIRGTLRLRVIDQWRAEPSTPVPFEVPAQGAANLRFTVTAGEGTFNASYPIHAIAEYEAGGARQVAHPVQVVNVRLPNPPRAKLPVEWKPLPVTAKGAMGLWRQPLARVLTTAVGQEIPVGAPPAMCLWQRGTYRPGGGLRSEPVQVTDEVQFELRVQRGDWREGLGMRLGPRQPSQQGRVERIVVEFPLELPKAQAIHLRFSTALADSTTAAVTSRIRVVPFDSLAGEPGAALAETRTAGKTWEDKDADLSRFAGQKIRLQLESACAEPAQVYWAEPTVIVGPPPPPAAFPPAVAVSSRSLGAIEQPGARYEVRLYPGKRGVLDSSVAFVNGQKRLVFRGFQVSVAGDALEDWRSSSELRQVREEPAGGRYRVRHSFQSWAGSFDLLSELWTERGAFQARFWLENAPAPRPWLPVYIEDVAAGPWSERSVRVYAGHGNVIEDPQAFQMDSNGHKLAASFVGFDFANGFSLVQAVNVPPEILKVEPETRHYSLHSPHTQTVSFIPAPNVWQGTKVWRQINGLRPSSGVPQLAGRFVIDLWGGGGGRDVPGGLRQAFRYGMTDAMVITHSWQRPFDPEHPGPGDKAALEIAGLCRANGVLFAPHDNYIDFYPDADFPGNPFLRFPTLEHARPDSRTFSYEDIVFTRNGEPLKAWLLSNNRQSYRARPDRVLPAVKEKWRFMKMAGATANFIDVYSSESVYDYYTWDGQFVDRLKARQDIGEIFNWIRDYTNNGPQTSEAGHDQLVGWVDGATAIHLRVDSAPGGGMVIRIRCADSERIPWMDSAHHDRFVLHGAGYEDRYASGLDTRTHGVYSDDYITTEVLTGHVATAQQAFSRDVVRKYWLLHDLMRGIALRNMDDFEFAGNDIHRQRVRWDNGGEFWVNRGKQPWDVNGHALPDYGFYARVPSNEGVIEAAIERRDGAIVEWAQSPSTVFVNARTPAKLISFPMASTDGAFRLSREAGAVVLTPLPSSPQFTARLRWSALPWKLAEPRTAEALDTEGRLLRTVPLAKEGAELVLKTDPDVFAYRLK